MTQLDWTKAQIEMVAAMDRAASMTNPRVKVAVIATQLQAQELTQAYSAASVGSPLGKPKYSIISVMPANGWRLKLNLSFCLTSVVKLITLR